jgi:hypothetical protein
VESRSSLGARPRKPTAKPDALLPLKGRLHHLFDQIEKEFDVILTENIARKYKQ